MNWQEFKSDPLTLSHRIFRRLLRHTISFFLKSYSFFYECSHRDYILLTSSVSPISHNWGDDVSKQIVACINPSLRIVQSKYSWNIRNKKDYLCIGSIISWMTTPRSVIWGSGVVYENHKISSIPSSVLAVRGPLTRDYLMKQGIACPEIYGDPALLFPRYYKPVVEKKHKVGIIPHFRDKKNPLVEQLRCEEGVSVIDVQDVARWTLFIDRINECEVILSSSLHGIIIADAYHIPNVWVEFAQGEKKRFAFMDYLASVKRDVPEPVAVTKDSSVSSLVKEAEKWEAPDIDLDLLLSVCPFKSS